MDWNSQPKARILLEDAMARLNVDDPDEAVQAALRLLLSHEPLKDKTT